MDYEKKYKEAIERAKELIAKWRGKIKDVYTEDYAYIFPELRESEDERIRKEIIHYLFYTAGGLSTEEQNRWIAWLEKQKEPEWNKKPCLTCQEYEKGFETGRLEGVTAGYNKAMKEMKEMEPKEQKPEGVYVDCREHPEWYGMPPREPKPNYCHYGGDPSIERCRYCSAACSARLVDEQKPAEWSEEYIANVFEKVGLAKIVREQGNNELTNAVQSAMLELSKGYKQEWSEEDKNTYKWVYNLFERSNDKWFECVFAGCYPKVKRESVLSWLNSLRPQKKEDLPKWKKVDANYQYPLCLTREYDVNGDYQYCLSSGKIYDGCEYISIAELELLPRKEDNQ